MGAAAYISSIQLVQNHMPPLLTTTVLFTMSAISISIIGPIMFSNITYDGNPKTGVFGFFNCGEFLLVLFRNGLIGGAMTFGPYGYTIALFSPIVLCTALLFGAFGA